MLNEKRIKAIIVISLFLIETFVWMVNGSGNSWSLGFIGGSDGPTAIIVGDGNDRTDEEKPSDSRPDENEDLTAALKDARDKGLLILVNKEYPIDREYKPDDLTKIKYYVPDRAEGTRYMRAEAAEAFHRMVESAALDGVELKMTTAYRSYDFQKILFDNYVANEGEEKANTFSARPGQSEHQTGLAVDVSSPCVDYQLSNDYGNTTEGKWIENHAHRFGFILRFPKGKEDVTGYQYEPWHLRYVGLAAAKIIYEKNLTLEEFLQENTVE